MCKKNVYLCGGSVTLFIAAFLAILVVVLKHEPNFYQNGSVPEGPERKKLSIALMTRAAQMFADMSNKEGSSRWHYAFTEAELNSFFDEDFVRLGEAEKLRKFGLSGPRVMLDEDRLRVGFRYGSGFWSTVVSYDLRVWLVPRETNTIAIEILNRRLGALPVSSQALLSELADVLRRHNVNVEMTLYRRENNPVAIIRFQNDGPRATNQLHGLKIVPASLSIAGSSTDQAFSGTATP